MKFTIIYHPEMGVPREFAEVNSLRELQDLSNELYEEWEEEVSINLIDGEIYVGGTFWD